MARMSNLTLQILCYSYTFYIEPRFFFYTADWPVFLGLLGADGVEEEDKKPDDDDDDDDA
jgi:hypothetical protein